MLKILLAVILVTCVSSFILPQAFDYYEEDEETYRPPTSLIRKRADPPGNTKLCGKHLGFKYKKICTNGLKDQQDHGPREEYNKFLQRCCDFGCNVEELQEYICKKS